MHGAERDKYPLNHPKFLAFLSSTHNGGRKMSVVYECMMKISALSSPFWFAIHEGYETKTSFRPRDQRPYFSLNSYFACKRMRNMHNNASR